MVEVYNHRGKRTIEKTPSQLNKANNCSEFRLGDGIINYEYNYVMVD